MRIAQVISSLDPGGGGLPKSAVSLASVLAEQGEVSAIIFLSAPGDAERIEKTYGAFPGFDKVLLFPLPKSVFPMLGPQWVAGALKTFAPDVVHTHGLWEPILAWAQIFSLKHSCAYVISAHSMLHPWHAENHRIAKWMLKHLLGWRRRWQKADFVHVLNEAEVEDWKKEGVCRTRLIPNGIFADEDLFTGDTAFPGLSGARFVLSLSRLHPQKAPDLLVKAFACLRERHPDLHLVLAGPDYGMKDELKRLTDTLGCSESVSFPGELQGVQKWNALHQCDCFCLPSRAEGFSLSLLEAAWAGAPLVMSKNCYFDDLAEAGGALISDLDVSALAEKLDEALTAGAGMGEAARGLVEAEYRWEALRDRFLEAYRNSLKPGFLK
ncbi:glycosyltransferase [Kiritimatiellaeota bacterium B1221]|nr:glycosyltransferase [Kiritimatiellaeota bacterium B1221]